MEDFLNWFSGYAMNKILPAVIMLVAGILVIRLLVVLAEKLMKRISMEAVAISLIKTTLRVALYLLLILIVVSKLGVDITGMVALASVLTLAISLSLQNALTNLISGFTLLHTRPFAAGDFVEIAGQSGTVKSIGLTYTTLATADNKCVSIPNGAVTAAQIVNYTVLGTRRVEISVSASYNSAPEAVLEALLEAAHVDGALDTPPAFAGVSGYGESAVEYVLHVWVKTADYWTVKFAVNQRIPQVFREKGVDMTYPHLHVHLEK